MHLLHIVCNRTQKYAIVCSFCTMGLSEQRVRGNAHVFRWNARQEGELDRHSGQKTPSFMKEIVQILSPDAPICLTFGADIGGLQSLLSSPLIDRLDVDLAARGLPDPCTRWRRKMPFLSSVWEPEPAR